VVGLVKAAAVYAGRGALTIPDGASGSGFRLTAPGGAPSITASLDTPPLRPLTTAYSRLQTLFELVRLPNIFTAPADVAMGLAVGGAAFTPAHAPLLLASAFAYAGGMALNDAWDAPIDAHERPERPIPSGRITRGAAFKVAAAGFVLCLVLAAVAGLAPLILGALLVMAIVFYDGFAKGSPLGPPAMAVCRGLNAGLGLAAGVVTAGAALPAALLFAYVLILTVVSRFEVTAAPVALVRRAALAFAVVLGLAAAVIVAWREPGLLVGILCLAALAVWLGGPLRAALADPAPRRIIGVIKAAVLGIILLDAAFTAGARGVVPGLLVAALFVPAWMLGRRFASA
jgi:4-hydroxybenzoate polyprenyltransferase